MSSHAGVVRSRESIGHALVRVKEWLDGYEWSAAADAGSRRSVNRLFLIRDILTSQYVYLSAMAEYLDHGGRSRGSVLYTDTGGSLPLAGDDGPELDLPEIFRFSQEDGLEHVVQESSWSGDDLSFTWRPVRPIPADDDFFENVWRHYREDKNVY
jgi:hypothetical protein